jgi:NTE family protein
LKIPFAVMATDINTGKPVKLSTGRVAPAVRASASVAGFVTPVELDGKLLVDGSFSDTVPVQAVREMGAEYVIGVDIFTPYIRRWLGPFGYGLAAIEIMVENAGSGVEQADCLIAPQLAGTTYVRFSKWEEFYRLGRQAAEVKLPAILKAIDA